MSSLGWEYRQRRLPPCPAEGAGRGGLRRAAPGAGREARPGRADGHRRRLLHRDRRRRAEPELRHPRRRHVRFAARSASTPRARRSRGWAPRARARATRPPTRRSSRPRSASRPRTSRSRRATPTPPPTASAPTARARRRSPAPPRPGSARKIRDKARKIAAHLLEVVAGRPRLGRRPVHGQGPGREAGDDEGDRLGRLQQRAGRAWSTASRRSTTTIRPT